MNENGWCIFEPNKRLRTGLSAADALALATTVAPDSLVLRPGFEPVLASDGEGLAQLTQRVLPPSDDGQRRLRSFSVQDIFANPQNFSIISAQTPTFPIKRALAVAVSLAFLAAFFLSLPRGVAVVEFAAASWLSYFNEDVPAQPTPPEVFP